MDKIEKIDKRPKEAAEKYLDGLFGECKHHDLYAHLFIAGWKCRDDQMPMPEDTVLFNKGVAEGRRLMMKEAVEGVVEYNFDEKGNGYYCIHPTYVEECVGDKVRIIVLKAEEE